MMRDDDFKKIEESLAMFGTFSDELENGFSFGDDSDDFSLSPEFVGGKEKELTGGMGRIVKLGPMAGGPFVPHVHEYSHLIVCTEGCVEVRYEDETIPLSRYESLIADGNRPHSIWNPSETESMIIDVYLV